MAEVDAAIAAAPSWPAPWSQKGRWLAALGRWDDAVACFEQALALNGGTESGRIDLGNALIRAGRRAEGEAQLMHAAAAPNQRQALRAHVVWAGALKAIGAFAEARDHLRDALHRDPLHKGAVALMRAVQAALGRR